MKVSISNLILFLVLVLSVTFNSCKSSRLQANYNSECDTITILPILYDRYIHLHNGNVFEENSTEETFKKEMEDSFVSLLDAKFKVINVKTAEVDSLQKKEISKVFHRKKSKQIIGTDIPEEVQNLVELSNSRYCILWQTEIDFFAPSNFEVALEFMTSWYELFDESNCINTMIVFDAETNKILDYSQNKKRYDAQQPVVNMDLSKFSKSVYYKRVLDCY